MARTTVWNDKTRSDLLQAIVAKVRISEADQNAILQELAKKGYDYTWSAATYLNLFSDY
jgi:hypothetical protein